MEKKILMVGLCCLDTVNYVEKYPPEDSDTRVFDQKTSLGGNAANSATVLRQFTENIQLCAALPVNNELLKSKLEETKIDSSVCILREDPSVAVPHSTVVCNVKTGSRTILHYRGNLPEVKASEFKEKFENKLEEYSWIHFEGRNFTEIREMMEFLKKQKTEKNLNLTISVEFEKIRDFSWFEYLIPFSDVIFMSKDFARSNGWTSGDLGILGLREKYGAKEQVIVCGWGEKGAFAIDPSLNDTPFFVEALSVDAIDTLGAGDCFIAAAVWRMYSGKSVLESVKFANQVVGRKCSQFGLLNISLKDL